MKAKISCYTPGQPLPGIYFFVLNKGQNSGKPLEHPTANCYVVSTETVELRDRYFYLCWALWQARGFEQYLVGSVIPFIRKNDFVNALELGELATQHQQERFSESVAKMCAMEKHILLLRKYQDTLLNAKRSSLAHLLRL